MDYIPGIFLKEIYKAHRENSLIYENLEIYSIDILNLMMCYTKKNEPSDINNIRPIAIIRTILKIMENNINKIIR